jgi:hypothetical protein
MIKPLESLVSDGKVLGWIVSTTPPPAGGVPNDSGALILNCVCVGGLEARYAIEWAG